jgi:hypothetical protein
MGILAHLHRPSVMQSHAASPPKLPKDQVPPTPYPTRVLGIKLPRNLAKKSRKRRKGALALAGESTYPKDSPAEASAP